MRERAKEQFACEKERIAPSLFCYERPEQIAHGRSCRSLKLAILGKRAKSQFPTLLCTHLKKIMITVQYVGLEILVNILNSALTLLFL